VGRRERERERERDSRGEGSRSKGNSNPLFSVPPLQDGRIKGYRSLGQQLFKLKRNLEGLEERIKGGEEGPAMTEALEKKKAAIKKLEDKGIVEETLEE